MDFEPGTDSELVQEQRELSDLGEGVLVAGLLVAGGPWAFRAMVLFGAMQFVAVIGL